MTLLYLMLLSTQGAMSMPLTTSLIVRTISYQENDSIQDPPKISTHYSPTVVSNSMAFQNKECLVLLAAFQASILTPLHL